MGHETKKPSGNIATDILKAISATEIEKLKRRYAEGSPEKELLNALEQRVTAQKASR